MATMVHTPVIGLYAATTPSAAGLIFRGAGAWDAYDAAARKYLGKPAAELALDHQDRAARRHGPHRSGGRHLQAG
jgi:hypothetical protein